MKRQNVQQSQWQNWQQAFRPAAQSSQNTQNQKGLALGPCFKRGMNGHFAR
jgi:hypothetical protein